MVFLVTFVFGGQVAHVSTTVHVVCEEFVSGTIGAGPANITFHLACGLVHGEVVLGARQLLTLLVVVAEAVLIERVVAVESIIVLLHRVI